MSGSSALQASGKELLMVSRLGVIGWGLIASGLCCMCTGAYISYNFMGDVLSVSAAGAVFPIFFSLLWNGCTCLGATVGTITGGCCGLIAWLVTAKKMYEAPTVLSLQNNEPMLAGCCISIGMGLIVCVILVSPPTTAILSRNTACTGSSSVVLQALHGVLPVCFSAVQNKTSDATPRPTKHV